MLPAALLLPWLLMTPPPQDELCTPRLTVVLFMRKPADFALGLLPYWRVTPGPSASLIPQPGPS